MEVTRRESTSGEDEVKLVLIELGLLDVDERPNLWRPVRKKVALGDGERPLEHSLRFRQVCA